jgi:SAM-dependent methyltransferase
MSPHSDTDRLAAASLAAGDPTGWFEKLYEQAQAGAAEVPWDRPEPTPLLVRWARETGLAGAGRRAMVVGCGPGRDAEFVAGLGFSTTAFDISATAVRMARDRHPGSPVDYRVADLLAAPPAWAGAFDLVVECNTVQALPRSVRDRATAAVAGFVAPGGTLLVVAAKATAWGADGPPWPLTRAEVSSFAAGGMREVSVTEFAAPDDPLVERWQAVFRRSRTPEAGGAGSRGG